jgi:hypothetical protein
MPETGFILLISLHNGNLARALPPVPRLPLNTSREDCGTQGVQMYMYVVGNLQN